MGALKVKLVYCDAVLSCQLAHPSTNRVSAGPREQYILDELWFLPRLYHCAREAGVQKNTPEMNHFSRWAFYLARQLGEMGKVQAANEMVKLSKRSSPDSFRTLSLYVIGVRFFGWANMNHIYKKRRNIK